MLKLKSFKFSQGKEISDLLRDFPIASGSDVFVSNGEIIVPIDDGAPMSKERKIVSLRVAKNKEVEKLEIVLHDQLVLEKEISGISGQIKAMEEEMGKIEFHTAPKGKKQYDENKEKEAEIKAFKAQIESLKGVQKQKESNMLMNQAQLTSNRTNMQVYDEQIAEAEKE